MSLIPEELIKNIDDIANLDIVPTMLSVLCQTTGMGFAGVAHVTDDYWLLCSANDNINFGLKPGDLLDVKTVLCNELKVTAQPLVIPDIDADPYYSKHITPLTYGFKSYASVPIFRKDGRYFGSLFAIDPQTRELNTEAVSGMLTLFSQLISVHLSTNEQMKLSEVQFNRDRAFINALEVKAEERTRELKDNVDALARSNKELEAFAYISSHDLQEPLRKIQTLISMISERESDNLSPTGQDYFNRIKSAAGRMQSLIKDLLTYSRAELSDPDFKLTNLGDIVSQVREDLTEQLRAKDADIEIGHMCTIRMIPFQFRQLLQNLITNSIKFARQSIPPRIDIGCTEERIDNQQFYKITVSDNGIGFEQEYAERIFTLFQRLNDKKLYSGTGIGLAIVKRIVDNHKGFITATGTPNQGATFNIYIPV